MTSKDASRAPAGDYDDHSDIVYPSAIPFVLFHLACFGAIWTGITWQAAALGVVLYWGRIFAIGAGYHRYFSHRAYSTGRVFQFILAFACQSTAQKSVLWWAAKHRHHHLHSDTEADVHSPRHKGFIFSHMGWIFASRHETCDLVKIADFARYPELMWLHRHERVPALVLAVACFLIAGWSGLVVGFFWSTVAVFHATFCINSLAHVHGRKRYVTGDDSRNNWLLAFFTMGEGWHNNHHACQSSVRQGFRWWEYDATFYILKLLSFTGLVWGLKSPPEAIVRNEIPGDRAGGAPARRQLQFRAHRQRDCGGPWRYLALCVAGPAGGGAASGGRSAGQCPSAAFADPRRARRSRPRHVRPHAQRRRHR
jgi:stearoyl-CoA desaturase (delta-9 desaturase)